MYIALSVRVSVGSGSDGLQVAWTTRTFSGMKVTVVT